MLLNSTQKQSVSLVYIAPTVNSMADGTSNYITNPLDTVISGARTNASTNTFIPILLPNMPDIYFNDEY